MTANAVVNRKQRVLICIWFSLILCLSVFCIQHIRQGNAFESNILGLLPSAVTADISSSTNAELGIERKFVLLIGSANPSAKSAFDASRNLLDQLAELNNVQIDSHNGNQLTQLQNFYQPYINQLLTPMWRHRLSTDTPQKLAQTAYAELFSPVSGYRPYNFQHDPFNLGGAWLQQLIPQQGQFRASEIPSLKDSGQLWYVISGQLQASPFSPDGQQDLILAVNAFSLANPSLTILRSGLVFHAAEATALSNKEISTVGIGSILAIIILVIAVFRSTNALLAIMATLSASVAAGLASCFLIFEQVHLITIAFGSTLLGLAVDYCFHFLIKHRQLQDAQLAGQQLAKGLLFSAGSSILAYVFQFLSPLAGLQQIAVFMCAGLAAAAINIVILSFYFRDSSQASFATWLRIFPRYIAPSYAKLAQTKWAASLVLIISLVVMISVIINRGGSDDIRNLNSSSEALLKSEIKVQTLLNFPDNQRYLRINASDSQQLLSRSVSVTEELSKLGVSTSAAHVIGRVLPPLSQQQDDFALIKNKIYGPRGALSELCKLLANDCSAWQPNSITFSVSLTPEILPEDLKILVPAFIMTHSLETRVLVARDTKITPEINAFISATPKVTYVDTVAHLSHSLQLFRHNTTLALGAFLIIFSLGIIAIYRTRAAAPLAALSITITASIALGAGGGISLFHILALLLVIGLSVDTSIFYLELGLNTETWLAASLAAITSILAFGLLALSDVPVLHQFGSVVFAGLVCTWLISPLVFYLFNVNPNQTVKNDPTLCNKEMLS
ncbi:MAG: hypothetical protein KKF24_00540 [Gammaproteobacteria bacterium]|jgi:predicted exporter|nr:hypothetical protein [Gammaproteobacteria bacterium]MBU1831161.1 hypothetical protein [Gammaproteobacteria bacterium]